MSISPVSLARVTQTLRSDLSSSAIRRNQLELLLTQTRIAAGRNFVTASEDPIGAARAVDLSDALARHEQFSANLNHADQTLTAADQAISEVSGLLIQAHSVASQDVSNLTSAAEREADAEIIAGIRRQLQSIGNRVFNGRYMFAGRQTTTQPFIEAVGGVAYVGDTGDLVTRAEDGTAGPINIPGNELFGALTSRVVGAAALTPSLAAETRLDDLRGANGLGIRDGLLVFTEDDGALVFTVDPAEADTIGDVVDSINTRAADAGSNVTATLSATGIDLDTGGAALRVTGNGAGGAAADLGLLTEDPVTGTINGVSLQPILARLTPVDTLAGGAGIDLTGGIIIRNGDRTATIDLSDAATVQDILNLINNSGVLVTARINNAGTGLELANLVSGTALTVGENGGTTASDLGLRTFTDDTDISALNFGRGITTDPNGLDLQVTAKSGATFSVNLDGVRTIDDVLDRINAAATAASISITASLATTGNGIVLTDATGGAGTLSVSSLGESTAGVDLGLTGIAAGAVTQLVGTDVSGVRTDGVLAALVELEAALRLDDTRAISLAAERVNAFQQDVVRVHGVVGARSASMRDELQQVKDASQSAEVFLSQVRDLDYAEAITDLQRVQTQLQASLQTSSILLNLSLMDYL